MRICKISAVTILVVSMAAGCATSSEKIAPSYVSPLQYQAYDCEQLSGESMRLSQRVSTLQAQVDKAAANDKALTGVGVILFWPALFALGGNQQQEGEYGRLKGEFDAIQQMAIQKKCTALIAANATVVSATATAPVAAAAVPASAPAK